MSEPELEPGSVALSDNAISLSYLDDIRPKTSHSYVSVGNVSNRSTQWTIFHKTPTLGQTRNERGTSLDAYKRKYAYIFCRVNDFLITNL